MIDDTLSKYKELCSTAITNGGLHIHFTFKHAYAYKNMSAVGRMYKVAILINGGLGSNGSEGRSTIFCLPFFFSSKFATFNGFVNYRGQ